MRSVVAAAHRLAPSTRLASAPGLLAAGLIHSPAVGRESGGRRLWPAAPGDGCSEGYTLICQSLQEGGRRVCLLARIGLPCAKSAGSR